MDAELLVCACKEAGISVLLQENVGWGLPVTSAFSASSLPSGFSGFWGVFGLFKGVFSPSVEFGLSGRRARVRVGWMGACCVASRGKKVAVRAIMEP